MSPVVSTSKLTMNEAVAAIQSKEGYSRHAFRLIREVESNAAMRKTAQRSQDLAASKNVAFYGDGIFIDLMRTGGFVLLEVDERSDKAVSLNVVSRAASGRVIIESNPVVGDVKIGAAQALLADSAAVVDLLLAAPINENVLENKFEEGRFPKLPNSNDNEANDFFAIPGALEKLGASQSDLRDLAVLLGTIETWPSRYAIMNPMFGADPAKSVEMGVHRLDTASDEFVSRNSNKSDVYPWENLGSVRDLDHFRNRVATLRRFADFLEKKASTPETEDVFAANKLISTIALKLGSESPDGEYWVMTVSGIIVGWKESNGIRVMTHLGLAGD